MCRDLLEGVQDRYDVIVVGSGLAGLTAANTLARAGRSVLLLEQHHKLGGLATWFRRPGGVIFDVSLHGFPAGTMKSCRRYWTGEIADSIVRLKAIRFDNPTFSLWTTYDRQDMARLLTERFGAPAEAVREFFAVTGRMSVYDRPAITTKQLFEQFFPGREDVVRLLMEPIAFANGSTMDDPASAYGVVFSKFMAGGVHTFRGGTDRMIGLMERELRKNGVDVRVGWNVEKIQVAKRRLRGVTTGGRRIRARAVVSNANLKTTVFGLVGPEHFSPGFVDEARAVRLTSSSAQVYMALRRGETIDEAACGDIVFSSTAPVFRTERLLDREVTSRTFSFYYPETRPGSNRCVIVAGSHANYHDWADLTEAEYRESKRDLMRTTLDALSKYVPDVRDKLEVIECATPCTFHRYARHPEGASFGTKFEGLAVSRGLPRQIAGLYHAGSVGIVMSGWMGAIHYGVIVANDVDAYLTSGVG